MASNSTLLEQVLGLIGQNAQQIPSRPQYARDLTDARVAAAIDAVTGGNHSVQASDSSSISERVVTATGQTTAEDVTEAPVVSQVQQVARREIVPLSDGVEFGLMKELYRQAGIGGKGLVHHFLRQLEGGRNLFPQMKHDLAAIADFDNLHTITTETLPAIHAYLRWKFTEIVSNKTAEMEIAVLGGNWRFAADRYQELQVEFGYEFTGTLLHSVWVAAGQPDAEFAKDQATANFSEEFILGKRQETTKQDYADACQLYRHNWVRNALIDLIHHFRNGREKLGIALFNLIAPHMNTADCNRILFASVWRFAGEPQGDPEFGRHAFTQEGITTNLARVQALEEFLSGYDKRYLALPEGQATLYKKHGSHVIGADVRFSVEAPAAKLVELVLYDKSGNHVVETIPMAANVDHWELVTDKARPGTPYHYRITHQDDTVVLKNDPFAQETNMRGVTKAQSIVSKPGDFEWTDEEWLATRKTSAGKPKALMIAEILPHVLTQTESGGFPNIDNMVEDIVAYCKEKGFNAVEFPPLYEHFADDSWGYQPIGYFSPTKRYFQSPEDLKILVDRLHTENIRVIMDMTATFSNDACGLSNFDGTPLYDGRNISKWGVSLFDTRKGLPLMVSAYTFYSREFHIDAFRVDAPHYMIYDDCEMGAKYQSGGPQFFQRVAASLPDDVELIGEWGVLTGAMPRAGDADLSGKSRMSFGFKGGVWHLGKIAEQCDADGLETWYDYKFAAPMHFLQQMQNAHKAENPNWARADFARFFQHFIPNFGHFYPPNGLFKPNGQGRGQLLTSVFSHDDTYHVGGMKARFDEAGSSAYLRMYFALEYFSFFSNTLQFVGSDADVFQIPGYDKHWGRTESAVSFVNEGIAKVQTDARRIVLENPSLWAGENGRNMQVLMNERSKPIYLHNMQVPLFFTNDDGSNQIVAFHNMKNEVHGGVQIKLPEDVLDGNFEVIFNTSSPEYLGELEPDSSSTNFQVLREGNKLVLLDVPANTSIVLRRRNP